MTTRDGNYRLTKLGDSALLLDAAGPVFDDLCQAKIWALASTIMSFDGVTEAVPGMNNLMIVFDPLICDAGRLETELRDLWSGVAPTTEERPVIEVPTVYGGAQGEDLAELAQSKGLSVSELVSLHISKIYTVAAVGAMPGFVYLSGLDPLLATPRRSSPRMSVPEGSVIIGGSQAGIMPITAPSGWHILGHTDLKLFNPNQDPPTAFKPGDRIRFVAERIIE